MKERPILSVLLSRAVLCLTLVTTLYCTGCISVFPVNNGDMQADNLPGDTQEDSPSDNAQEEELSDGIHFPSEYLITYEVENAYGTLYRISGGKDAQGRIYFKRQLDEILFVPTNGGYYQYYIDTGGMLIRPDNKVYTQALVDEMMQGFLEYAQKYTLYQSDTANYTDRIQIAGRDCKIYEINITTANLSQEYTFATDDETGACMEWRLASKVMNYTLPTDIGFRCTEFVTTDVELPISD